VSDLASQGVGAAGQPAQSAAPQPAQAGGVQAPSFNPEEVGRWKRGAEQYEGVRGFVTKAQQFGIKGEKELEAWGPLVTHAQRQGWGPDRLMAAFFPQQPEPQHAQSQFDPEEFEKGLMEKLSARERERMEKEHQRALDAEYGELADEKLFASHLKGVPKPLQPLYAELLRARYSAARQPYPEDHALKGMHGPAGRTFLDSVPKTIAEWDKAVKAAQMNAIAEAAQKPGAAPPAGSAGGQGAPDKTKDPRRAQGLPSREEIEASHAQRVAARSR